MDMGYPKITFEDLKARFLAAGFKYDERPWKDRRDHTTVEVLFYRKIRRNETEGPVCLSNDRLSLHITVHEMTVPGHSEPYRTVAFDITGEYREGAWAKLSVYAVPWGQAAEEFERVQRELLTAWDAIYGVARS